jgi:hypothetical protein
MPSYSTAVNFVISEDGEHCGDDNHACPHHKPTNCEFFRTLLHPDTNGKDFRNHLCHRNFDPVTAQGKK